MKLDEKKVDIFMVVINKPFLETPPMLISSAYFNSFIFHVNI